MRGTRGGRIIERLSRRIIPAGAGDTPVSGDPMAPFEDHPRGCGGHGAATESAYRPLGSSPRVRGTRRRWSRRLLRSRIIPAGAGDTWRSEMAPGELSDHPRGCGGHVAIVTTTYVPGGSSPRVRGTHGTRYVDVLSTRIIPAGAGDTRSRLCHRRGPPDHPRGCGGHSLLSASRTTVPGSSPRVRGTLDPVRGKADHRRIIPAGAGDTRPDRPGRCASPDHPRGCGGHAIIVRVNDPVGGSSPRVRGTLITRADGTVENRIIPAGAGDTSTPTPAIRCSPDHPRGCGGHPGMRGSE